MEHNFSNGPNGWGNYGGTNMYDSDTNTSNATDQDLNMGNNDWETNGAPLDEADFAALMGYNAGAQQPDNTFMGPVASNNEYVLNVPQPGPPPPPLQAVWDSATSTWVYPVPVPQQQQQPYSISRAPIRAYDTQLPFRQLQDVGQNAANNAAALKPQPKQNGQRAKKVSLAQGCACQTNAEEHIPRPMNKFMLYRQHVQKAVEKQLKKDKDSTNISKVIGGMWAQLPAQTRKYWADLADEVKLKHAERHPHWKYKPGGKNDKKWGTEECTCGAFEANEAKRERVEAESESEAPPQRVVKQPRRKKAKKTGQTRGGFDVNYGIPVPGTSRKRKASLGEPQSTPKRIAGSSRSGQPQLMLDYTNDHSQASQFGDYNGELSMNIQSDTTQGYFTQSMAAGNGGYDTSFGPFAAAQNPGAGYSSDMLPEEMPFDFSNTGVEGGELYGYPSPFSTRPRETVLSARPQNPADFQLTPMAQMFATGELANGDGFDTELGDDFWNIDNSLDYGGDWNQQGQGTDADRTPTQASFTRRSTRLSAQKGNSAESATSPTRRLRSQGKA